MSDVDERVVQMTFDNAQFERGVDQTLKSLDKLEKGLNFETSSKNMKQLEDTARRFDLSNIGNQIFKTSEQFNVLYQVGTAAIRKLTSQAVDMGERLVKSLTIDNVSAGFQKYEDKTAAVQTISAATGKTVDEVNESLGRLAWFTDETSYNFVDMVRNIGKFTSNNVDLETSVTAMEGIANLAALSGQGTNEASRAMYNFAQAISVGNVKLMDWRSIENANMATTEFKKTIIDTALSVGTLIEEEGKFLTAEKKSEVSVTNFNEALSEGWFTSDVLLKSLDKYGEYANKVYDLATEKGLTAAQAMELLGDAGMELGAKAFNAAQNAKTFTEAINATKDAVSTGWMNSFELIFGNLDEAKELWSDAAQWLYEIFAQSAEGRNAVLETWKELGGRKSMLEGVYQVFRNIQTVMQNIKSIGLTALFGEFYANNDEARWKRMGEKLAEYSKRFADYMAEAKTESSSFDNLRTAANKLHGGLKKLMGVVAPLGKKGFNLIFDGIAGIMKLANGFIGFITFCVDKVSTWVSKQENLNRLLTALGAIRTGAVSVLTYLLGKAADAFQALTNINLREMTWEKFIGYLDQIRDKLAPVIPFLRQLGAGIGGAAVGGFQGLVGILGTVGGKLDDFATNLDTRQRDAKWNVQRVTTTIGELLRGEVKLNDIIKRFDVLPGLINSSSNAFAAFMNTDGISQKMQDLNAWVTQAKTDVGSFATSAMATMKSLDYGKIVAVGLGASTIPVMLSVSQLANTATTAIGNINGTLKETKLTIASLRNIPKYNIALKVAAALGILAVALIALANTPIDKLKQALTVMRHIAVILGVLMFVAALCQAIGGNGVLGGGIWNIVALAGAMALIGYAFMKLYEFEIDSLGKVLEVIVLMAALCTGLIVATSIISGALAATPGTIAGALTIIAIALAMEQITNAFMNVYQSLMILDEVGYQEFQRAVEVLIGICACLALIGFAVRGATFGGGLGLLAGIGALWALIKVIEQVFTIAEQLANIRNGGGSGKGGKEAVSNKKKLDATLKTLVLIIGGIIAIMAVMALITRLANFKGMLAVAGMMAVFYISFRLLVGMFRMIQSLMGDFQNGAHVMDTILASLVVILGVLAVMAIMAGIANKAANGLKGVAAVIFALTVCAVGLGLLAKLLEGNEDPWKLLVPIMGIVAVIIALGVAVSLMRKYGNTGIKDLIALSVCVAILVAAAVALSLIPDVNKVLMAAGALAAMVFLVGLAVGAAKKFSNNGIGEIVAMAAAIGVMAAALYFLAQVPVEGLKAAWKALAILLGVMTACVILIGIVQGAMKTAFSKSGSVAITMLAFAAAVGILAVSLWLLAKVPADRIWQLVLVILALSGIIVVATIVLGAFGPATLTGAAAVALFGVGILALVGAMVLLAEHGEQIVGLFGRIGGAIGKAVSGAANLNGEFAKVTGTTIIGWSAEGEPILADVAEITGEAADNAERLNEEHRDTAQILADAGVTAPIKDTTVALDEEAAAAEEANINVEKLTTTLGDLQNLQNMDPTQLQGYFESMVGESVGSGMEGFNIDLSSMAESILGQSATVITPAGTQLTDDLIAELTKGEGKAEESGIQIVNGFARGIDNNAAYQAVIDAAVKVAQGALDAINNTAQIASPSKVTTRSGRFIGEGLANGLLGTARVVAMAGSTVSSDALDAMSVGLSRVRDVLNGNMSLDTTIRPVVDVSGVSDGVRTINGMMSRTRALQAGLSFDANQNGRNNETMTGLMTQMLRTLQNPQDLYLNDRILAGRINRRLGKL